MSFLLDTNIISELARQRPDAGVAAWARTVTRVAISCVSVEELQFGLSWKPNARIEQWLDRFLSVHCDVIEVTAPIARCAGRLRGDLQARGHTRTQADMLIAATALMSGLTLVTRNTSDFTGCSVTLLNPFEP